MNQEKSQIIINDTSLLQANFQQTQVAVRSGRDRVKLTTYDRDWLPRYSPTKFGFVRLLHEVQLDLRDASYNLKALSHALKNEHLFFNEDSSKRLQNMFDGFRFGAFMFKNITKNEVYCGNGDAHLISEDCFRKLL